MGIGDNWVSPDTSQAAILNAMPQAAEMMSTGAKINYMQSLGNYYKSKMDQEREKQARADRFASELTGSLTGASGAGGVIPQEGVGPSVAGAVPNASGVPAGAAIPNPTQDVATMTRLMAHAVQQGDTTMLTQALSQLSGLTPDKKIATFATTLDLMKKSFGPEQAAKVIQPIAQSALQGILTPEQIGQIQIKGDDIILPITNKSPIRIPDPNNPGQVMMYRPEPGVERNAIFSATLDQSGNMTYKFKTISDKMDETPAKAYSHITTADAVKEKATKAGAGSPDKTYSTGRGGASLQLKEFKRR